MLRSIPLVTKGTTKSRKETMMFLGTVLLSAACHSLPVPDRPPAGTVSVEAVLTPPPWQRDGQMCVRVSNGTADPLRYRPPGLRLDRHVRAGRWRTSNILLNISVSEKESYHATVPHPRG